MERICLCFHTYGFMSWENYSVWKILSDEGIFLEFMLWRQNKINLNNVTINVNRSHGINWAIVNKQFRDCFTRLVADLFLEGKPRKLKKNNFIAFILDFGFVRDVLGLNYVLFPRENVYARVHACNVYISSCMHESVTNEQTTFSRINPLTITYQTLSRKSITSGS